MMKKRKVTIHIINTRRGEPSEVDPTDCEIWEAMITHDYREPGIPMDLERAEELCKKMMEKDK